jgi:hypothetical protein
MTLKEISTLNFILFQFLIKIKIKIFLKDLPPPSFIRNSRVQIVRDGKQRMKHEVTYVWFTCTFYRYSFRVRTCLTRFFYKNKLYENIQAQKSPKIKAG